MKVIPTGELNSRERTIPGRMMGLALGLGFAASVQAQTPLGALLAEQSRTFFNLEGTGARAMGQGGAFVAIADDATAVSFNPAGLAQLIRPEISFSGLGIRRRVGYEDFQTAEDGGRFRAVDDSSNSQSALSFKLFSATYPFSLFERSLVIQCSAHRILSFQENSDRTIHEEGIPGSGPRFVRQRMHQGGGIDEYSLATAYELSQRLLIGAAFNHWRGQWDLDAHNLTTSSDSSTTFANYFQQNRLDGENWTLGLLWRGTQLRWGITYHTPFEARYRYATQIDTIPELGGKSSKPSQQVTLQWPSTLSLGMAYRPSERWQVALDWSKTRWSRFKYGNDAGDDLAGTNFLDLGDPTRIPNTTVLRGGVEYLHLTRSGWVVPWRMGLFREPQPMRDAITGTQRVLIGATAGMGMRIGPWGFDLAYRYAFSRRYASKFVEVEDLLTGNVPTSVGREKIEAHRMDLTVTYHFSHAPADLKTLERLLQWALVGN